MIYLIKWVLNANEKKIGIAEIVLYPMSVNGQVGRKIKRRSGKKVGERVEIFPGGGVVVVWSAGQIRERESCCSDHRFGTKKLT